MEPQHARVHLGYDLSSAASIAHAMRDAILDYDEVVRDALSTRYVHSDGSVTDYVHVAREKCDVIATSVIPSHVKRIRECLMHASLMLADTR
jgi:hypothetical protein